MKFKFFSILFISQFLTSYTASALQCSSNEGPKLSWGKLTKASLEGASHVAEGNWGTWGFYDAECVSVSKKANHTQYECFIEPEWTFFELVAVVDMSNDQKSATMHLPRLDKRYSKGYRIEASYNMNCQ